MAYMNQDKKAVIAAQLKKVVPAGWKYSLRVHNHSTLVLTVQSAPVDLCNTVPAVDRRYPIDNANGYRQLNTYHLDYEMSGELLATFEAIKDAMNLGNHDNSDPQVDYFDVGHYVSIHIGAWDKPFRVVA